MDALYADTGGSGAEDEGARERRDRSLLSTGEGGRDRSLLSTDAGVHVRSGSGQVGKGGGDELYLRDALGALPCLFALECVCMAGAAHSRMVLCLCVCV